MSNRQNTRQKSALPYKVKRQHGHYRAVADCGGTCGTTKEISLTKNLPSTVVLQKFADHGWERISKFGALWCSDCRAAKPSSSTIPILTKPLQANETYMDVKIFLRQNRHSDGRPKGLPQLRFVLPSNFFQLSTLEVKPKELGFEFGENKRRPQELKILFGPRTQFERAVTHSTQLFFVASVGTMGWKLEPRHNVSITVGGIYHRLDHSLVLTITKDELVELLKEADSRAVMEQLEREREAAALQQELSEIDEIEERGPARAFPAVPEPEVEPLSAAEEQILNEEIEFQKLKSQAVNLLNQLNMVSRQLNKMGYETYFHEEGTRLVDDLGKPVRLRLTKKFNL